MFEDLSERELLEKIEWLTKCHGVTPLHEHEVIEDDGQRVSYIKAEHYLVELSPSAGSASSTIFAKKTKHTRLTAITALFLAVGSASVSNAQSINPSLDDIFQLRLGPFFAHFDTKVNVQGTDFDQDERLGDNETTFAGFARWRITPKFHLNFGYSQISRDNTATLSADLPVGGITVPAGTTLSQDYETSSLPVSLSWAFVKNPKTEFGVDAG
jgi:hypothetical protein